MEYYNLSIFLISSRDPLSNLISFMFGETYNSIGICYPTETDGYKSDNMIIYNTWQSSTPTWLEYLRISKSNITKADIFNHELIDRIVEYPINIGDTSKFTNILSKILIEGQFLLSDELSYDWLIRHQLGLPNKQHNETGYDIINYIFKMLINPKCEKPSGTMNLIKTNVIDKPIYKKNIFSCDDSNQINHHLFDRQVDILLSSLRKIFVSEWITNRNIRLSRGPEGMKDYIEAEDMLIKTKRDVSHKKYLEKLNSIRVINSLSGLSDDSFDIKSTNIVIDSLSELKEWILDIIAKSKADEVPIVRMDKIIDYYNKISSLFNLEKIVDVDIPHVNSVLSLTSDSVCVLKDDIITLMNPRLERFNADELREILKYLNEVSVLDNKYITLQKIIALKLSDKI